MSASYAPENTTGTDVTLHRAAWVVPVGTPPIANGAVLVQGDTILAVGGYGELKGPAPHGTELRDHGHAALIPALVNAHTHLELSGLRNRIPLPQKSFGAWLQELFSQRASAPSTPLDADVRAGEEELLAGGTGLYGDIANSPVFEMDSPTNPAGSMKDPSLKLPHGRLFLEILGFDRQELTDVASCRDPRLIPAFLWAAEDNPCLSLAAHACYSTSGELIRQAKGWSRLHARPFSIHAAEHPEEMEFLRTGSGYCRSLLESLGRWVPGWQPPGTTPVQYLHQLGALDAGTLLVHLVHMTAPDWEILAQEHCSVCFCPRSNHYLNAGQADISTALRMGLVAALGTDSLASNTDLNLFAEAAFVLDAYPDLSPHDVLKMMTWGGAKALHHDTIFGTIEAGKHAALLAVTLPEDSSPLKLAETIIDEGRKGAWQWTHS
ncbi:amidohydrolase family protein [Desulforhabdus sp. TSK]|uniref:amidohydrolase family protein n=1 Tax=Desulforhabdus sp. TSK TaxID=2925014 RepID=UPI001FC89F60|nr:amidohydrolase family protein [Desulforhabdus sp. TSK]GKT07901.1 metal-dependent hydrolase [Desulforhabdus sp. TSK]